MKDWIYKTLRLLILVLLLLAMPQAQAWSAALASNTSAELVQENTPDYGIITSTPQSDGAIYHIVKEGESLWAIATAYGTTGAEIMTNSGNSPAATEVFIGQVLTIRRASPPTNTPPPTATPTATPFPTLDLPTRTPIPSSTPFPSPTPTLPLTTTQKIFGNSRMVGLTMASVSLAGLILLLIFAFFRKSD